MRFANYGFDVTPARLVSGLIAERGVLQANRDARSGSKAGKGPNGKGKLLKDLS
jgi:methylthioribose-1-phosphate isomerase